MVSLLILISIIIMEIRLYSTFVFISQFQYACTHTAKRLNFKISNFNNDEEKINEASVHLKLTQQFDHKQTVLETDTSNINVTDTQNTIIILEYILKHNDSTVLASIGSNVTRLEIFSDHVYKANLTTDSNVELRERRIDLQNDSHVDEIMRLWKSERLLAQSKDPINKSKSKDDFMDLVLSHASRVKMLRRDNESDAKLIAFMDRANLTKFQWSEVAYDVRLDKQTLLDKLKQIAVWFRSEFPYYYSGCDNCMKLIDNEFVGYVYPSQDERVHQAGRTELYCCTACASKFRFPRFNAFGKVLSTRKGRCGEYSIVMLKLLQMLGYSARWVVDWADHVWVEAYVGGSWVHVDPCEAAVDEPLLYQGWGKNQTYIIAFTDSSVEDVTAKYTTNMDAAINRRESSPARIEEGIRAAELLLRNP